MAQRITGLRMPGVLLAMFAALVFSWSAVAETSADGTWRLRLQLSSFHTGPIASFDELVHVQDGALAQGFSRRETRLAISLAITDGAVSGRLAVTPDNNWANGTRGFQGVVADGVFEGEIHVPAFYLLYGDEGGDYDSRMVVVRMRLERQ